MNVFLKSYHIARYYFLKLTKTVLKTVKTNLFVLQNNNKITMSFFPSSYTCIEESINVSKH